MAMADQHPITPPFELVRKWAAEYWDNPGEIATTKEETIAIRAARWGSDMELDACCEWFVRDWTDIETADKLRAARRPKPKSLAEEALEAIDEEQAEVAIQNYNVIRRALERLQALEGQGDD